MAQWFQGLREVFWICLGRVDIPDTLLSPGSVARSTSGSGTTTSASPGSLTTTSTSPVLYLSKIDKEKFEWLRKESVELDGDVVKSNNRRGQVLGIFTWNFRMILGAAVIGNSIDIKHITNATNVARVILLVVVALIVIIDGWTKARTLLRLESRATEIQRIKVAFCRIANNFVSSTNGVERDAEGATDLELKDEIARMQSMIELHSVPVRSYKWVYLAKLGFSFFCFALCLYAWLVMIKIGKLHFPQDDVHPLT